MKASRNVGRSQAPTSSESGQAGLGTLVGLSASLVGAGFVLAELHELVTRPLSSLLQTLGVG